MTHACEAFMRDGKNIKKLGLNGEKVLISTKR